MNVKPCYPNLEDSMRRNGIRKKDIADLLGLTRVAVSMKFNGKSEFKIAEAFKVQKYIETVSGTEYNFNYLFDKHYKK